MVQIYADAVAGRGGRQHDILDPHLVEETIDTSLASPPGPGNANPIVHGHRCAESVGEMRRATHGECIEAALSRKGKGETEERNEQDGEEPATAIHQITSHAVLLSSTVAKRQPNSGHIAIRADAQPSESH